MRLIDADDLQLKIDLKGTNKFGMLDENIRDFINDAPTVDAVPVVYCKYCKYRTKFGNCGHPRQHGILPTAYSYDFCSYGRGRG